ncbi:hypothetical protein IW262DRAFT_660855 [Armillaria fumosa]|nr:hypothetical protein IW262DRAFT_660855 [Armillaria fumosa]
MSSLTLLPISDIPASLNIGATFGTVYIGATIAAVFYGITVLQTVIYYKQNSNDPWIFRYAVALLWILDTLHVALSTHALYFYLIESFGRYPSLFTIIWSFPLQLVINMLIVFGVQLLYAVRIWKLGHHFHTILPRFIFVTIAIALGTGIYVIYNTFLGISTIRVSIYMVFSTIAGADFIVAGSMCFYLHKGRSMTSFTSTTKIIVGLMRLVVISGSATSACSFFILVAYIAWPHTLIFIAADFILPKLYINSLLAMLNSRKSPMWSGAKERPFDQKMLKFAPRDSSNGVIDSGETNLTVPLSIMESSQFTGGVANMTFA